MESLSSTTFKKIQFSSIGLKYSDTLDKITPKIYEEYNNLVEEIINEFNLEGIQLLLTFSCRNTFTNLLFDPISKIILLKEISNDSNFKFIEVDKSQLQILNELIKHYKIDADLSIDNSKFSKPIIFKITLNILKSFYTVINDWFWLRSPSIKKMPKKPITYVDSFLYSDSIDLNGETQDRNYAGFESFLTDKNLQDIWFVPTIYGVKYPKQYKDLSLKLKKTKGNILIQESWLSISDYLISFLISIFMPFSVYCLSFFTKSRYAKLIRKVVTEDIGSPALMISLYRYFFIRRLSKNNIKINGVVDWNENHTIDRALNLSIRKYYPGVIIRGYQGYPAKEYNPSYNPTEQECLLGTIPHEMHLISDKHIKEKKASCSNLKLVASGAFRYSYLYRFKDKRARNEKSIFFALPLVKGECDTLIDHAILLNDHLGSNIVVNLKYHPAHKIDEEISEKIINAGVQITSKSSMSLLEKTSMVVTAESGIAVEAVALGIPVAVHGNNNGISLDPLANVGHYTKSIKYYGVPELIEFTSECIDYNERNKSLDNLFYKPTRENTAALFLF